MQQIRTPDDLLSLGTTDVLATLRDNGQGSPALRRQVTRVLAAWSQISVNGRDGPEPPERLPSLFDRVHKMLRKEGLGLYLEPSGSGVGGADQDVKVTHKFFLMEDRP